MRIQCHKGGRRYGPTDEVIVCEDDKIILEITDCAPEPSIRIAGGGDPQRATRRTNDWRWEHKVRYWAGFLRIRIAAEGHEPQFIDIAIAPNGKKASRDSFMAMIGAVAEMAPRLPWGFALGLLRGRWDDGETSLAVRASLIRSLAPEIVTLATEMAVHPPRTWRSIATLAPFGSRQMKPATQRQATTCPMISAALSAPDAVGGHRPFAPAHVLAAVDAPVLSLIAERLSALRDLAEETQARLLAEALNQRGEANKVRHDLAGDCGKQILALNGLLTQTPYSTAPTLQSPIATHPQEPQVEVLLDLLDRVTDCGLAFDTTADADRDLPAGQAKASFDLYELFCLWWLREHLTDLLPDWYPSLPPLVMDGTSSEVWFSWTKPDEAGVRIDLGFQIPFAAYPDRAEAAHWSISTRKVPDFIVARVIRAAMD
ncbi:MAG: hypothetical protein VR70_02445 [Rhodospirillaceae bacterium BRH_c57]|nr:MAG: hypothetical protein VR70_02445 [Rhodospirillaceae bacterium BRH_c57]